MKIREVLNLICENNFKDSELFRFALGHFSEGEEQVEGSWGEKTLEKSKKDKNFVSYSEAKMLYDELSNKEKKFVSPNGSYKNSPMLLYRLGDYKNDKLAGFIDVYYFPNRQKSGNKDGFITMAVSSQHRGKGVAKKLLKMAVKKAKEVGLDTLTWEVEHENKPSINFIKKFNTFKNETPSDNEQDSHNLIFRCHISHDEDEMTTAILSDAPQGSGLCTGDNYATSDMRIPKIFPKIQRRKKRAL